MPVSLFSSGARVKRCADWRPPESGPQVSDHLPHAELTPLGWDHSTAAAFAEVARDDSGIVPARVASVARGAADVLTPGELRVTYAAALRAAVAADPVALPCPGDWV